MQSLCPKTDSKNLWIKDALVSPIIRKQFWMYFLEGSAFNPPSECVTIFYLRLNQRIEATRKYRLTVLKSNLGWPFNIEFKQLPTELYEKEDVAEIKLMLVYSRSVGRGTSCCHNSLNRDANGSILVEHLIFSAVWIASQWLRSMSCRNIRNQGGSCHTEYIVWKDVRIAQWQGSCALITGRWFEFNLS